MLRQWRHGKRRHQRPAHRRRRRRYLRTRRRPPAARGRRPGDPARRHRDARRQAARRGDRGRARRPRRRVDAGPPPRGRRAGPRRRPRRPVPGARDRDGLALDAGRPAADAQGPCDGRARGTPPRCTTSCPPRAWPASSRTANSPRPRSARTSASASSSPERVGREVVDRLVEPLLGGVYAGDAYKISMRAAVPQLFEAARSHGSLARRRPGHPGEGRRPSSRPAPVFAGLDGGIGTLPGAVADAVRAAGGEIRMRPPVLDLPGPPTAGRSVPTRELLAADGVILSAPAWAASALLAAESPVAAAELSEIEYASMALVTLAFRRGDLAGLDERSRLPGAAGRRPHHQGRPRSPRTNGSGSPTRCPDLFVLRTSIGRYGEERHLDWDDADLVDVSLGDLGDAVGLAARPVATQVTRWIGGLPQYPVGHLAKVARVRAERRQAARPAGLRGRVRRCRHPRVRRERPAGRGRDHRHVDPGAEHPE